MSETRPRAQRHPGQSGVFSTSEALRREPWVGSLAELDLEDVNELRLLLRGDSVVDWHRLDLRSGGDVRRLLALNSLDVDDERDRRRLRVLRSRAVRYIAETLKLRIDKHIAEDADVLELPLLASGKGKEQRQACLILKLIHIMYHLDARELRTRLAISDNDLFSLVERSVVGMFEQLRSAGLPVVEFSWSRKTPESLVTKMLVKRETSAARVFDRLRFRLVVETPADLLPTLHAMLRQCIPFNYVVPGQTWNTLIDISAVDGTAEGAVAGPEAYLAPNEFSGRGFRVLNFIADLPVRVDELLPEPAEGSEDHGRVVFVLTEFQILDRVTGAKNEQGENAHLHYKQRQHSRVKERLLRAPTPGRAEENGGGES